MTGTSIYWILFIGIALASWIVSASLQRKFRRYAQHVLRMYIMIQQPLVADHFRTNQSRAIAMSNNAVR